MPKKTVYFRLPAKNASKILLAVYLAPVTGLFAEALIPNTLFQDCVTNAENVCLGGNLDQAFFCFPKKAYICKIPLTRRYTACRPISHVPTYTRATI